MSVVPAVATTATGTMPSARSASIAAATASGRRRLSASIGSARTYRGADPEQLGGPDDRVVDLGGAVEREPPAGEAVVPRAGTARSRAAVSAVRFEMVPPLVNEPASAGKPTSSPAQRTAWSSTSEAAPAQTARLTS